MRPDKLENIVRRVLEDFPETRNDDILLQMQIIKIYAPGRNHTLSFFTREYVSVEAIRLYREDNIKRVRAKIQNVDGHFLPTDPVVRKKRRVTEEMWRDYVGAPVGVDGGNPSFT